MTKPTARENEIVTDANPTRDAKVSTAIAIEGIERDAWLNIFRAVPRSYVEASGLSCERLVDATALADRGVPIAE